MARDGGSWRTTESWWEPTELRWRVTEGWWEPAGLRRRVTESWWETTGPQAAPTPEESALSALRGLGKSVALSLGLTPQAGQIPPLQGENRGAIPPFLHAHPTAAPNPSAALLTWGRRVSPASPRSATGVLKRSSTRWTRRAGPSTRRPQGVPSASRVRTRVPGSGMISARPTSSGPARVTTSPPRAGASRAAARSGKVAARLAAPAPQKTKEKASTERARQIRVIGFY